MTTVWKNHQHMRSTNYKLEGGGGLTISFVLFFCWANNVGGIFETIFIKILKCTETVWLVIVWSLLLKYQFFFQVPFYEGELITFDVIPTKLKFNVNYKSVILKVSNLFMFMKKTEERRNVSEHLHGCSYVL